MTRNQNKTSLKKDDGSSLNADKDAYGVAPKDLAKATGGPLKAGDKMGITLDGRTKTKPIGDFGPKGKNGQMSSQAARDLGLGVKNTKHGPIPTRVGATRIFRLRYVITQTQEAPMRERQLVITAQLRVLAGYLDFCDADRHWTKALSCG